MEIDVEDIKLKLYERLKSSGWAGPLKSFLLSDQMSTILKQLEKESLEGRKFTPRLKQVFRSFEQCPYDKLSSVMLLQDPYPFLVNNVTVADGIAMSCGNTLRIQPSLSYVHEAIGRTVYNEPFRGPLDLAVWANQGLLLLNIALTTTIGKVGAHYMLWREFLAFLLDHLSWHKPGLAWVFAGKKSQEYMRLVNDNCYKFTCIHPAAAAYQQAPTWDCNNVFVKLNEAIKKEGRPEIIWK